MTLYADLTEQQAAAALEEFLQERSPALRRLELAVGDAVDLDHSVESLGPLWVWAKERLRLGPSGQQPSWSRLGLGEHERLDEASLQLLDGLRFPASISTRASSRARLRAVPGARAAAGSSPACRNGSPYQA